MGYWELVRRAGYRHTEIIREVTFSFIQLCNIDDGSLTLNFPNTHNYQQDMPRSTVVTEIFNDLKRSPPEDLPFKIEG